MYVSMQLQLISCLVMRLTDDAYVYHSKCNGVHLAVFLVSQGKTYF